MDNDYFKMICTCGGFVLKEAKKSSANCPTRTGSQVQRQPLPMTDLCSPRDGW